MGRRTAKASESMKPSKEIDTWGEDDMPEVKAGLGFIALRVGEYVEVRILTKPKEYHNHPEDNSELRYPDQIFAKVDGTMGFADGKEREVNDEWMQIHGGAWKDLRPLLVKGVRNVYIERKKTEWIVEPSEE